MTEGVGGQTGAQTVVYNGITGLPAGALQDPLWYTAKYGAFNDSDGNGLPNLSTEWDVRKSTGDPGGPDGTPDTYFLVSNPLGLEKALRTAFNNVKNSSGFTSVSANSTSLTTLDSIYQASFVSDDWHGKLESYKITNGNIGASPQWDAGLLLNGVNANTRAVITFDDTAGAKDGVPFRWGQVSANLTALLNKSPDSGVTDNRGSDRLNWLRGDTTLGSDPTTGFRDRKTSLLGDIVNSDPVYVGPPNAINLDPSYVTFRAAKAARPPMLYVGANDGMLHGFDAKTGVEQLAYVPSKTFPNLTRLTSSSYTHQFYVDGSVDVADAQLGAGAWHTVLAGGLGLGGQGIYALDVTDVNFSDSAAGAKNTVLWEFNDTDDKDLGFVTGKPVIRKVAYPGGSKWAVIVSGGYNNSAPDAAPSTTGRGYIFVIFLDGPTGPGRTWVPDVDYVKIDSGVGTVTTPNGLAAPLAVDATRDGITDYVYAGDLQGNMWKFDIRSTALSTWKATTSRVKVFQARETASPLSPVQPITARADAIPHPTGRGYVLLFGTGKFLETTDRVAPFPSTTFYGIWDKDDRRTSGTIDTQTTVTSRDQLLQQVITNAVTAGGADVRTVTKNAINWSTDTTPPVADDSPTRDMGWFADFPSATTTGERVVFRPVVIGGRLIFTTFMPSAGLCDAGGSSYVMLVDPASGARFDEAVLDVSGDGQLTNADQVAGIYASGLKTGILGTPTVAVADPGSTQGVRDARILLGGGSGNRSSPPSKLLDATGRVTWREVLGK